MNRLIMRLISIKTSDASSRLLSKAHVSSQDRPSLPSSSESQRRHCKRHPRAIPKRFRARVQLGLSPLRASTFLSEPRINLSHLVVSYHTRKSLIKQITYKYSHMRSFVRAVTKSTAKTSFKRGPSLILPASRLASTLINPTPHHLANAPEMATEGPSKSCNDVKDAKEKLPPLSAQDFQIYNHMAEHMDLFVSGEQRVK